MPPEEIANLQIGDYLLIRVIGRHEKFQALIVSYQDNQPLIKIIDDPSWRNSILKPDEYEILSKLSKNQIKKNCTIEEIARICHKAYLQYCQAIGDYSQAPWQEAPEWQRESAKVAVKYCLENPQSPAYLVHNAWKEFMIQDGWKYSLFFNEQNKEHPWLTSFQELSQISQMRTELITAITDEIQQVFKYSEL